MATTGLVAVFMAFLVVECAVAAVYSSRILHRFSDEMKAVRLSRNRGYSGPWPEPERRSLEYYQMLLNSDLERQKMKLGPQYPFLFPSKGSKTYASGNDLYWLHYTWIDLGKPSASFLVAVDTGSDLLWVPCDCIECAPLSEYNLDQELNVYSPSVSRTSKQLTCGHQLCEMGPNCKSPKDFCPYKVSYLSENTSTSGLLVQDILHLSSGSADASNSSVRAPVVIGCGRKQSGEYLTGAAPDGLLGLGPGEISVPSFLSKAGFAKNSFSLCFNEGEGSSGRIFFGDQGSSSQQITPFLPLNGKYPTYIVQVEACCIGNSSCLEKTSFKALVDSGSSFTTLPDQIFKKVAEEFDKQVNANRATFPEYTWEYCYEPSSKATIPSLMLKFAVNNTFLVHNPVIPVQETGGFCLAIFSNGNNGIAIIGQNYMTGYRMVFDRENLTLGWSKSNCQYLADDKTMPLTPSVRGGSPDSLPTAEQQRTPDGQAIAPAVAGRTPSNSAVASIRSSWLSLSKLLLLVLLSVLDQLLCTY